MQPASTAQLNRLVSLGVIEKPEDFTGSKDEASAAIYGVRATPNQVKALKACGVFVPNEMLHVHAQLALAMIIAATKMQKAKPDELASVVTEFIGDAKRMVLPKPKVNS